MIKRRPDRIAAAILLTALVASLSLLTHPSGNASAVGTPPVPDISAALRYGCATSSDPSFVEVSLLRKAADGGSPTVQVGLTGIRTTHGVSHYPDGGPSLVTLASDRTVVRLAGSPVANDQVFVRLPGQPAMLTLPVPSSCQHLAKSDFALSEPEVNIAKSACNGVEANLKIQLINHNTVTQLQQQFGLAALEYTVLLVNSDGWTLAGAPASGQLVSFTEPGRHSATLQQSATSPASYQIRVIGPDGQTTFVGNTTLNCESVGKPGPSSTVTVKPPRPSPTATAPESSTPGEPSKTPGASHSRPHRSPSATPTATRSSAPASHAPATDGGSFVNSQPGSALPVLGEADSTSQPVPGAGPTKAAVTRPVASPPTSKPTPKKTIAEVPRLVQAVGIGGALSTSALLIVVAFAVSMAGLVATNVRNARRR